MLVHTKNVIWVAARASTAAGANLSRRLPPSERNRRRSPSGSFSQAACAIFDGASGMIVLWRQGDWVGETRIQYGNRPRVFWQTSQVSASCPAAAGGQRPPQGRAPGAGAAPLCQGSVEAMCRNITTLRGLEPVATS